MFSSLWISSMSSDVRPIENADLPLNPLRPHPSKNSESLNEKLANPLFGFHALASDKDV
jgi:hypothetical protein